MLKWNGNLLVFHDSKDYPKEHIVGQEQHPVLVAIGKELRMTMIMLASSQSPFGEVSQRGDATWYTDKQYMQAASPEELANM